MRDGRTDGAGGAGRGGADRALPDVPRVPPAGELRVGGGEDEGVRGAGGGDGQARIRELNRLSARFILDDDAVSPGFHSRREIAECRAYLNATEPAPAGWGGRLPGLPDVL